MAIGVVTDDSFEKELERLSGTPTPVAVVKELPPKGRGTGTPNVPMPVRKLIGETAISSGRAEAVKLAETLSISKSSVSAYVNDAVSTSTYHEPSGELESHNDNVREDILKQSRLKLQAALQNITSEKLAEAKPRDLSGIAKDMAGIVKDMEPSTEKTSNGVQFVFMAPQIKKTEESYEIIDVDS